MTGQQIGLVLVLVCAGLEGLGQVFLKKSVLGQVRRLRWIFLGVILLATEATIYTRALQLLDVSIAFTFLSLNLVAVTLLSQWLLKEEVTRTRWIGVGLIFAGAALVMSRA